MNDFILRKLLDQVFHCVLVTTALGLLRDHLAQHLRAHPIHRVPSLSGFPFGVAREGRFELGDLLSVLTLLRLQLIVCYALRQNEYY